MTTFDERERSYEAKFALDDETNFKIGARRNRLLGEWATSLLGKDADATRAYAKEVVEHDFTQPGDDDVIEKLVADLTGKADEATIRAKLAEFTVVARKQLLEQN